MKNFCFRVIVLLLAVVVESESKAAADPEEAEDISPWKFNQGFTSSVAGTYKKMDYSSFCSGSWARITSEATCKAAAAALDLEWAKSWDGPGDFPGCLHTKDSRNSVYFNTSPNPSNNPNVNANYAEICQAQAVDGGWSGWGSFGPCSKSCGNGTKTRCRTCSDPPPAHGGQDCHGEQCQTFSCNLKPCLTGRCENGKIDPVDTTHNWTTGCFDVEGNSYTKRDSLESCCGCFEFICRVVTAPSPPFFNTFYWRKNRKPSCCQDCEGTVFPAGSTMKVVEENDSCKTTVTTQCIYISQENRAMIQEMSTYKDCCSNSSGTYATGTSFQVPKTCSVKECVRSAGRQEASWVSTQKLAGCNCCVYNGSMINDGGWLILPNGQNASCCEGKLVVAAIETTTVPSFGPGEKCFFEDTNITFHDLGKNGNNQNSKPIWQIDNGGRRLISSLNTRPSVGITHLGDPTRPVSFSGRVFSNSSDDDVIGMVFGYQNETNFFVVASSKQGPGPTNWYVGRLHATCGTSCATSTTISDAIWNPSGHPKDITILSNGTSYWQYPNIYEFFICFNPSKLLLSVEIKEGTNVPLKTGTISAKTGTSAVDNMSKSGGFIGVYVDSQSRTTWDHLDCTECDLTPVSLPPYAT